MDGQTKFPADGAIRAPTLRVAAGTEVRLLLGQGTDRMIEDTLGLCGTVVAEKYQVLEAVGRGGFAVVYRARHLLWKRPVALKVFRALEGASGEELQALTDDLVREASLLAELSEKTASICQARDLGMLTTPSGQSLPYMVLEWLEGRTLSATLAEEQAAALPPRSLEACITLLGPVAEALAVAHTRGIAHRDVKPANVFLSPEVDGTRFSVKLLDFGIAKVVQDAQKTGGAFQKTAGHVTAFTPNYGAPEQFSRKFGATGPWTDVFAFALVLVECASGRRLVQGNDVVEMARIATDTVRRPTPRNFGVYVSDATEAVFARAVAVEPAQRWPTAGDFWMALLGSLGLEPSRPVLVALDAKRNDLFAGLGTANTAPAPLGAAGARGPSMAPPSSSPLVSQVPATSGKKMLVVLGVAGFLTIGAMMAVFAYSRREEAAIAGAARPAPSAVPSSSPSAGPSASPSGSASGPAVGGGPQEACPGGMVLIPRGEFFMGSDDDSEGEKPAHHVELAPYCIDLYEVTTARYVACSDGGKCKRAFRTNEWAGISSHEHDVFDPLCSARDAPTQADHPIVCVDWEMANTFCHAQERGRLPTEAEWEFAARGPDGRRYPWGDEHPSPTYLNACGSECLEWAKALKVPMTAMYAGDDGWPNSAQVGSFPKGRSRFGLYDVAGNVGEWVADWNAPYTKSSLHDPTGPETGTGKVIRGGAWNGAVDAWVRPTFRFSSPPENRSYGTGFRCAATPR